MSGFWMNSGGLRVRPGSPFQVKQKYEIDLPPVIVTVPETGEEIVAVPARKQQLEDTFQHNAPNEGADGAAFMQQFDFKWIKEASRPDEQYYTVTEGEITNGVLRWIAEDRPVEPLIEQRLRNIQANEDARIQRVASLQEQIHLLGRQMEIDREPERDADADADEAEIADKFTRIAAISAYADQLRAEVKAITTITALKKWTDQPEVWPDDEVA